MSLPNKVNDYLLSLLPLGYDVQGSEFVYASVSSFFKAGVAIQKAGLLLERPTDRAARLGISRQAVQLSLARGQISAIRLLGSRLLFVVDSVNIPP